MAEPRYNALYPRQSDALVENWAAGGTRPETLSAYQEPWAAKVGTSQAITSPLVQRFLANQRYAAPAAPVIESRSVLPLLPYETQYGGGQK